MSPSSRSRRKYHLRPQYAGHPASAARQRDAQPDVDTPRESEVGARREHLARDVAQARRCARPVVDDDDPCRIAAREERVDARLEHSLGCVEGEHDHHGGAGGCGCAGHGREPYD